MAKVMGEDLADGDEQSSPKEFKLCASKDMGCLAFLSGPNFGPSFQHHRVVSRPPRTRPFQALEPLSIYAPLVQ